jgi:hypothetical protein
MTDEEVVGWFSKQTNLEISHEGAVYGDDDIEDAWVVHRVSGSINDREWTRIAQGESLKEAMENAYRELTRPKL